MSEEIKEFSFENEEYRQTYWHTCSHIMAQAVKRLWPEVKLAIGPSIKEGWYYDMDAPFAFTPEHMTEIEAEMRKICKEKLKLERFELPREEAIKFMEEKGEPYKVELIQDLPEDAPISFYKQGEFTDLCAGPHLDSTGRVKGNAIKLLACNAAYWRGDSNRETLQRIYGIAFPKKEELDAYLERIEEAKRRDHRKLGKELGLFAFRDEAPGFPFLGQGASTAAGAALGNKIDGRTNHVFCVIGDGEADEGQVWESFQFAYAHKLDNLIYFIDKNGYQLDGPTDDILAHGDLAKKAESFGLYTQEIDGHDVQAIYDAIQNAYAKKGVPSCIVLDTCKGKGATFAEPKHDHSSQPNEEQWAEAIAASEKALEAVKNA